VNYLNAVALYAVKTHQYSFALDTFTDILDLYNARSIDNVNEQFLVAISNYLAFLRRSSKKLTSRLLEVEAVFKDLFVRFFTKSILKEQGEAASPTANLLAGLYRQNEGLLTRHQKDINAVITHFYQQQFKTKRKMPEDMIDFVYKQKVKKTLAFRLPFSADQLNFYSAPRGKSLNVSRIFQKDEEKEKDPVRLNKIEAMLEQSIEMLTEQKIVSARYATLQRNVQTNKASEVFNSFQSVNISRFTNDPEPKAMHTLQPLPRGFTRKR
jgi:hypothetical protein